MAEIRAEQNRVINWEEFKGSKEKGVCWLLIDRNIIDVTRYLPFHPGGSELLQKYAGDVPPECTVEEMEDKTNVEITFEELAKHNSDKDCWVAIDEIVYDVTDFLNEHPGGSTIVIKRAGKIGTEGFHDVGHSENAKKLMETMIVGKISKGSRPNKDQMEMNEEKLNVKQIGIMFIGIAVAVLLFYLFNN